jgi:hypothetical protein
MLRRKPTKIQVQIEDKDELEEARKHTATTTTTTTNAATTTTTTAAAAALLHKLDRRPKDPSISHRLGLSSQ